MFKYLAYWVTATAEDFSLCKKMNVVSGETKCKLQKLFFFLQGGSIKKLGVLTFI